MPCGVAEECHDGCDSWEEGFRKTKLLDRGSIRKGKCGLGQGGQGGEERVNIQGQSRKTPGHVGWVGWVWEKAVFLSVKQGL